MQKRPRTKYWRIETGADLVDTLAEITVARAIRQNELTAVVGKPGNFLSYMESGGSIKQMDHTIKMLRHLGVIITVTLPGQDGAAERDPTGELAGFPPDQP